MQAAISWSNYVIGVSIVAVGYYLFIGLKYYRKELSDLFSGKLFQKKIQRHTNNNKDFSGDYSQVMEGTFDELEEVVEDLRRAILEKAGKQTSKHDLLQFLKRRLEHYSGLRKPAFRVAINHYIIRQAAETCQISFHEDELNEAWQQVLQR
ncbi:hypothetical protein [Dyadobacter luteus]|nr:hypothetical protein [Dyadobacter luteus]